MVSRVYSTQPTLRIALSKGTFELWQHPSPVSTMGSCTGTNPPELRSSMKSSLSSALSRSSSSALLKFPLISNLGRAWWRGDGGEGQAFRIVRASAHCVRGILSPAWDFEPCRGVRCVSGARCQAEHVSFISGFLPPEDCLCLVRSGGIVFPRPARWRDVQDVRAAQGDEGEPGVHLLELPLEFVKFM